MSDQPPVEHPEVVTGPPTDGQAEEDADQSVDSPAKVMRVGTMIKQLLEEVRETSLDEPSRVRLREIYDTSVKELASTLSDELREELERLAPPFAEGATPSDAELRIAKAQLVGWLEGLFHGIQATLFSQQMAARQQLEDMRRRLPAGQAPPTDEAPGTYL